MVKDKPGTIIWTNSLKAVSAMETILSVVLFPPYMGIAAVLREKKLLKPKFE